MMITNEQRELLKLASVKTKQVKDLRMKESISIAGITWSKFAEDKDGNACLLADRSRILTGKTER